MIYDPALGTIPPGYGENERTAPDDFVTGNWGDNNISYLGGSRDFDESAPPTLVPQPAIAELQPTIDPIYRERRPETLPIGAVPPPTGHTDPNFNAIQPEVGITATAPQLGPMMYPGVGGNDFMPPDQGIPTPMQQEQPMYAGKGGYRGGYGQQQPMYGGWGNQQGYGNFRNQQGYGNQQPMYGGWGQQQQPGYGGKGGGYGRQQQPMYGGYGQQQPQQPSQSAYGGKGGGQQQQPSQSAYGGKGGGYTPPNNIATPDAAPAEPANTPARGKGGT